MLRLCYEADILREGVDKGFCEDPDSQVLQACCGDGSVWQLTRSRRKLP
jgi:hypothetical protein